VTDSPKVFLYQDGEGKQRHGDPTALLRRLHLYCNGDYNELLAQSESEKPETALPASQRLAKAVCQAFHLGEPWDDETGEGVLEDHWRGVLGRFLDLPGMSVETAEAMSTVPPVGGV
jgi:hypothetical protein